MAHQRQTFGLFQPRRAALQFKLGVGAIVGHLLELGLRLGQPGHHTARFAFGQRQRRTEIALAQTGDLRVHGIHRPTQDGAQGPRSAVEHEHQQQTQAHEEPPHGQSVALSPRHGRLGALHHQRLESFNRRHDGSLGRQVGRVMQHGTRPGVAGFGLAALLLP